MAIPSYFFPGAYWAQLERGSPTVGLSVINPSSGPGIASDPSYAIEVSKAQAQNIRVLGYVYTSYGKRSLRNVMQDIDKHFMWYKVDGIFLDEASNNCSNVAYYQSIFDYTKLKSSSATIAINPGGVTQECYVTAADIILNFENIYTAYVSWKLMGWEHKYPAEKFWHLIHKADLSDMPNALNLAKSRNAGWIYVTPDTLPNPWDTLPPNDYWIEELKLLSQ